MQRQQGFSLIEVLIALIFMSLAFLPIYNLFRFGSQGTVNNVYEVTANNYASDLVNFIRDLKVYQIDAAAEVQGKNPEKDEIKLKNDDEINVFFKTIGLNSPPSTLHPFVRSVEMKRYKGNDVAGIAGTVGWLRDLLNDRRSVDNYLIRVCVQFPRSSGGGFDDVTLFSMVLD